MSSTKAVFLLGVISVLWLINGATDALPVTGENVCPVEEEFVFMLCIPYCYAFIYFTQAPEGKKPVGESVYNEREA